MNKLKPATRVRDVRCTPVTETDGQLGRETDTSCLDQSSRAPVSLGVLMISAGGGVVLPVCDVEERERRAGASGRRLVPDKPEQ